MEARSSEEHPVRTLARLFLCRPWNPSAAILDFSCTIRMHTSAFTHDPESVGWVDVCRFQKQPLLRKYSCAQTPPDLAALLLARKWMIDIAGDLAQEDFQPWSCQEQKHLYGQAFEDLTSAG